MNLKEQKRLEQYFISMFEKDYNDLFRPDMLVGGDGKENIKDKPPCKKLSR